MPSYEYRCPKCETTATLRRLFSEFDDPAECLLCGWAMQRVFAPTRNLHIPIHFRMVLTGGEPGGGLLTFEDIHGVSSVREFARLYPNAEPYDRANSAAGAGKKPEVPLRSAAMADAFMEAKATLNAS